MAAWPAPGVTPADAGGSRIAAEDASGLEVDCDNLGVRDAPECFRAAGRGRGVECCELQDAVDLRSRQRAKPAGERAPFRGILRKDELIDRPEMLPRPLADRRVHRVTDHCGARDDRRAQQRTEHDEQGFARSPHGVAHGEATQDRPSGEDEQEGKRDQKRDESCNLHRSTGSRAFLSRFGLFAPSCSSPTRRPSRTVISLSACAATVGSCVTRMMLRPSAWSSASSSSRTIRRLRRTPTG